MLQTIDDRHTRPCYSLFSKCGIPESQQVGPVPPRARARDARGRFAKGYSGNPQGRPRGIRNPRLRLPDLSARKLSPQALSDFLDRKPHLLLPLMQRYLPPRLSAPDPAERLGIDLSQVRTAEDQMPVVQAVWAALARGDIAPREGARIVRRMRARLRRLRRLERRMSGASPAARDRGL